MPCSCLQSPAALLSCIYEDDWASPSLHYLFTGTLISHARMPGVFSTHTRMAGLGTLSSHAHMPGVFSTHDTATFRRHASRAMSCSGVHAFRDRRAPHACMCVRVCVCVCVCVCVSQGPCPPWVVSLVLLPRTDACVYSDGCCPMNSHTCGHHSN